MKIIKEEYSIGTQSASLSKIIESESGLKIRVDIKSDSYDFQSYARVSVFNKLALQWNIVDTIPHSNMKTPTKLYYHVKQQNPNVLAPQFSADTQTLVKNAEAVLGESFSITPISKKLTTKKIKP